LLKKLVLAEIVVVCHEKYVEAQSVKVFRVFAGKRDFAFTS